MNVLNHARTAVAYAQVAVAAVSTVYIGVVLVEGVQEVLEERRDRKARQTLKETPNTES